MRILVVGASGAVGGQLVPVLRERGHAVVGTSRTPAKRDALARLGAEAVVLDALDGAAVARVVRDTRPEVIVHQATALTGALDPRRFETLFVPTNRLRTEGTAHLIAAA